MSLYCTRATYGYFIHKDVKQLIKADGANGLWTSTPYAGIWWQSGQGFWYITEYLNTMASRTTDLLYFGIRWAGETTSDNHNQYVATGFLDDQAWWGNGGLRMVDYIRSTGDYGPQKLTNSAVAVKNDNQLHSDANCSGGVYWEYKTPSKNTISNVLTMELESHLFAINGDISMLTAPNKLGSIDLYNWMLDIRELVEETGEQFDTIDSRTCEVTGGPLDYEYGVLLQGLVHLYEATDDQHYLDQARIFADKALSMWMDPRTKVYKNNCETCTNLDLVAFKGTFFLGLSRLYDETKNQTYADMFINTFKAMVEQSTRFNQTVDDGAEYFVTDYINGDYGHVQKDDFYTISLFNNLALTTAALKVFQNTYPTVHDRLDLTINGLLTYSRQQSTPYLMCICNDFGCPLGHTQQCFTQAGHHDLRAEVTEKSDAFLVAPNHKVTFWDNSGTFAG
ncbi:unnamed protein product, partial [Didymodactylos carnosus]